MPRPNQLIFVPHPETQPGPMDQRLRGILSPETRLLLLAAAGPDADAEFRDQLSQPLNWARVVWLMDWERATRVLWQRMKHVGTDTVPGEVAELFERLSAMSDFRALYLQERLQANLDAFAREGIAVVLLKGAALGLSVYPRFVDRPMADLDLLVPPERERDAWRIATEQGWKWRSETYPEAWYEHHHHMPPLFDERVPGARLELHSRLSVADHPFSLTFSDARAVGKRLAQLPGEVMILDDDYQVIHIAIHFLWSHEGLFGGWRAFRDIGALAARGGVDWNRVARVAGERQGGTCCYWTLRLAHGLCGVKVPREVLQSMPVHTPGWLKPTVERHLVTQLFPLDRVCPSEQLHRRMWTMAVSPRRIGQRAHRPWDTVDVELQSLLRKPQKSRVGYHLGHLEHWWRYFRLVSAVR